MQISEMFQNANETVYTLKILLVLFCSLSANVKSTKKVLVGRSRRLPSAPTCFASADIVIAQLDDLCLDLGDDIFPYPQKYSTAMCLMGATVKVFTMNQSCKWSWLADQFSDMWIPESIITSWRRGGLKRQRYTVYREDGQWDDC